MTNYYAQRDHRAFAERMAHQSVANRRIYLIATSALARARHTDHRRNHPC